MPIHDKFCPKHFSKTVQKCTCKPTFTESEVNALIEKTHMAGQAEAGIDPSYSNARCYAKQLLIDLNKG